MSDAGLSTALFMECLSLSDIAGHGACIFRPMKAGELIASLLLVLSGLHRACVNDGPGNRLGLESAWSGYGRDGPLAARSRRRVVVVGRGSLFYSPSHLSFNPVSLGLTGVGVPFVLALTVAPERLRNFGRKSCRRFIECGYLALAPCVGIIIVSSLSLGHCRVGAAMVTVDRLWPAQGGESSW